MHRACVGFCPKVKIALAEIAVGYEPAWACEANSVGKNEPVAARWLARYAAAMRPKKKNHKESLR